MTSMRKRLLVVAGVVVLAIAGTAVRAFLVRVPYTPPPLSFSGTSEGLRSTVVVPTLDAPIDPAKSAVWCLSLELAWKELARLLGGPPRVQGDPQAARWLNGSKGSADDMDGASVYATAGRGRDGIVDEVTREMGERFPGQPPISLPSLDPQDLMAFGFLSAAVDFEYPYLDGDLEFHGSDGRATSVNAWGLRSADANTAHNQRSQVDVLYEKRDEDRRLKEFAVDPCRESTPNQVVLASVPPGKTLGQCVTYVERAMSQKAPAHGLEVNDVLLVPTQHWVISRAFPELQGQLMNPGFEGTPVAAIQQQIRFRLDRSGVEVASSAWVRVRSLSRHLVFDHPFLVYMKKRGAARPFFAMWVATPELLQRR